jgi:hypothetical protein
MVIFAVAEISGRRPAKTKATVLVAKAPTANHIRRLSIALSFVQNSLNY